MVVGTELLRLAASFGGPGVFMVKSLSVLLLKGRGEGRVRERHRGEPL